MVFWDLMECANFDLNFFTGSLIMIFSNFGPIKWCKVPHFNNFDPLAFLFLVFLDLVECANFDFDHCTRPYIIIFCNFGPMKWLKL